MSTNKTQKFSLILRVEATKTKDAVTILGKSLSNIGTDLKSGRGLIYSVFGGKKLVKGDIAALLQYTSLVGQGVDKTDAFNIAMQGASATAQTAARTYGTNTAELYNYIAANRDATYSTNAFRIAIKQVVANLLLNTLITSVIILFTKLIGKLNDLSNASKHAAEQSEEFAKSVNNAFSNIKTHSSTLSELNEEFQELSKGVDKAGKNIGLSSDEYDRYKEIVGKISEIMPNMTTYFNAQGEKIGFVNKELKDLNKEYQKYIQNAATKFVVDGDENGNTIQDTLDNFENNNQFGFWEGLKNAFLLNNHLTKDIESIPTNIALDMLDDISQMTSAEDIAKYLNPLGNGKYDDSIVRLVRNYLGKSIKEIESMTEEELNSYLENVNNIIETLGNKNEVDMSQVTTGLLNIAYSKDVFWDSKTSDEMRDDITTFLSSLNADVWNALNITDDNDADTFVNNIINAMLSNKDGFADAWNELFSEGIHDLPVNEYTEEVKSLIDIIAKVIGVESEEDKLKLIIGLGFDIDTPNAMLNGLKQSLHELTNESNDIVSTKWLDTLSEKELEYVTLDAFEKALQERKEYVDNAALSLEDYEYVLQRVMNAENYELFGYFNDTILGKRIQHASQLFKEGEISHKQYFDTLQNEIENVDFSHYLDSLEEIQDAEKQFFTDSVQQSASGLSSLINKFDSGKIGVSEYLDGYLSIAETVSTLTDSLQENSGAWNKNSEAMSDAKSNALDTVQNNLHASMNVIKELQDSTYALEQITSGAVDESSDEFKGYTNLIAADLAGIVSAGGEMADDISSYMGQSADEIAKALLEDTSNFAVAEEAIAENTNVAVTNMANTIAKLFDELGKAISEFKVNLSFKMTDDSSTLLQALRGKGSVNYELSASGGSLQSIGNTISSFGKSISEGLAQQLIETGDYHRGTIPKDSDSKYTPSKNVMNQVNDAVEDVQDAYGGIFDFFERRVKVLEDAFGNLEAGIENVVGAKAKNTLLSAQLGVLDEETRNYTDALAMYREQANNVLSTITDADLREKIVNGSVSLVDFEGENAEQVKSALEAYQGWADKIAECTQKLEELKTQIRQLELQKFNNIIEDFTDQFDIRGTAIDNIDKQIGLLEESGELVGKGYYEQQIIQAKGQLNILERQKSEMVKSLSDAINSGRIQKGTEEWQEMVTAIQQIDGQIIECKTDVEKFNNAIQEIDWNNFNRLQDIFSGIHDELGNLAGLFDDANDIAVSDGKGNWTNEALATLGVHAQQYETAKYQVEQYANEIEKLEADYAAGNISATEYIDRLSELKQEQWNAVESMKAAEDAMISLNEKRIQESIETINKEIDAYKELINAKLEALDAEKDLHDYRKSIAEKSKSITDIEKQLAAMANDDSLAAKAKKAQLREQLAEARKDLEETEYDHSIETQKEALSKQAEDYEKARQQDIERLEESLKNREILLLQSFNTVKQNAITIGQEILTIAQQHGINVDNVITTAWSNGSNAIAGYGQSLTTQSSAFISNLEGVELKVLDLQTQADTTSYSIANMFGQQANTLINQLASSWTSEYNLNTMTGILQNSLINTLERGYNISSLNTALGSVESGINNITSAANSAASALSRLLQQQQSMHTYRVLDNRYGRIVADGFSTPQEAQAWLDSHAASTKQHYTIAKAFAKGTKRVNEDQLAWTDEHGKNEMIIRRSDGAILTRLEKDDAIANANLAENLFKWGEINPNNFMNGLNSNTTISKINVPMKESKPNITLDYDLNIGSFTDGEHLLNTIQKVSKDSAKKLLNDINRDYRIHGR